MPLKLTLVKKLADGLYKATGKAIHPHTSETKPVEVLVKETEPKKLTLLLDSKYVVSKMDGHEINHIEFLEEEFIHVESKVKEGMEIIFDQKISYSLKKK